MSQLTLLQQQKLFVFCSYKSNGQDILVQECDIKYNFLVKGSIASHNLNIQYKNTSGSNQDMFFNFAQSEDICYDQLQVRISDQVIDCQVKEKQETENECDQKVNQIQKKISVLGAFYKKRGKLQVKIGNVEQDKEFSICFKYTEQLNLQADFYRMSLPFFCSQKQMDKQNLEISGDIYALTDQEKIVLSKFDDSSNLKADFNSLQADHTKIRASFDDQQINLSDQNHQKRTYLNIQYSRNDATPSSYQSNSEISPQTVVLSQTPSILQVKQQILESIQNNTNETYSKKKNGQKYFGLRSNFKEGNWQKQAKAKEDLIIKKNIALKSKEKEYKSVQQKVIQLQSSKGSWLFNNEIVQLLNLKAEQIKLINPISQNVPDFQHIWITILTIHWLQTYFQENCYQHQYILLKAIGFVDKIKKQYELPDPKIPLQKLFQNYSIKKD